ncbi:MAG TPA: DUF4091 domain-containing protein, partial [bacterium]|nr:DUF4091 domain-containing protein [bacterium]
FGRSGTNLADLDNDGVPEVLVTRSNVNNKCCLIAVSGRDGTLLWRTQDVMQGYVSNAVVDFERDGKYEVIHADKGNNLYVENSDGSRRWHAPLDQARGVFWAPAVADVDGDGQLEILVGMRQQAPNTGVCAQLVGADGSIKESFTFGTDANAAPAIGDIDGDGGLEAIVVTKGPNQIQCLTWESAGRVAWPSLRGNSAMTAASNVKAGVPQQPVPREELGEVKVGFDQVFWGENVWDLSWSKPVEANSFVEITIVAADGSRKERIVDVKPGSADMQITWSLAQRDEVTVGMRMWSSGTRTPQFSVLRRVRAVEPQQCGLPEIETLCKEAIHSGDMAGADTSGLALKLTRLQQASRELEGMSTAGSSNDQIAGKATALRKQASELKRMGRILKDLWARGDSGTYVFWQDANPWDAFDPAEIPEQFNMDTPIRFEACQNEFEDAAVTLFNVSSRPLDVRCMFRKPDPGDKWYQPEPDLARRFTLRRSVAVPTSPGVPVFDALPELDRSRCITIPAGEARQLWLVLNTHGMEPGTQELTLYFGSLEQKSTFREVPIRMEIWPVALPTDIYAAMNWCRVDPETASEQTIQDMVDHGISVSYGPPLPAVPVDEQGNLAGLVDWSKVDACADRVPRPWTFLFNGPPSCRWPEGFQPEKDSEQEFRGFQTAIAELTSYMQDKGFDYDHWAFMTGDEPWNNGFGGIPEMKQFCEKVKRADSNVRIYANPAGLVRVEYLEEFRDLIDIWQPEVNTLKRDPELVKWFREHAKRFWFYEASNPAKNFLPLGYNRAYPWYAWYFGAEGGGKFVYKSLDDWWLAPAGDWSSVYQTDLDVVPSRRWEAERDGVEDYRAFRILQREIDRVRGAGRDDEADKAQAVIDQAIHDVIGWQIGTIDEITRQTRDYELDYQLLLGYRTRIVKEIIRLREFLK